jgi:AcrR family transcriptional regulator
MPAAARRRDIADAALRVIAAGGLGRFTSLALAREVGVSDAALFRHFPSKEAIVDAAVDRLEELLFEAFPPQGGDPLERLGAFFRRRVEVIRTSPGASRLVATDELARAGSPRAAARVAAFRARSVGFVRDCLAEAARDGLLAPGVGIEEGALVVLGALLALAHAATAPPAPAALAPPVWKTLEALLRAPRGARRSPPRSRGPRRSP